MRAAIAGRSERRAPAACGSVRAALSAQTQAVGTVVVTAERGWYRRREVAGPMKCVQRRRAVAVRRAGRLVLCTVTTLTFGEYAGRSSTAGRARQVFCRSLCRPVGVSPTRSTRAVLASRAPRARCRSITLVRCDNPAGCSFPWPVSDPLVFLFVAVLQLVLFNTLVSYSLVRERTVQGGCTAGARFSPKGKGRLYVKTLGTRINSGTTFNLWTQALNPFPAPIT